jgi:hypothetical protein
MIPWYVPILTALVAFFGGVFIRGYFDRRADRRATLREVRTEYLKLTDSEPNQSLESYRLWALQRAGALRLTESEFDVLILEIAAHGKPAPTDDSIISILGVRGSLLVAEQHKIDLKEPDAVYHWIIMAMAKQADKQPKERKPPVV